MSAVFDLVVIGFGIGRVAIGLAPFVAARPASRLLGFPQAHDNATTRLMARMFGVRDIGLGLLAFYAVVHPEVAAAVFLFNALMDAGDLFAISIPLAKRQGIDRGAALSAMLAVGGGLGWLVLWLLA